jgi:ABC-type transporter Mla subunit MlaD
MAARRSLRKRVSDTFQVISELGLTHSYERQAGTVTIIVVVALIVAVALATTWRRDVRTAVTQVTVEFPSVAGLASGNRVTMRGVRVGRVEHIKLEGQGHVLVTLSVRSAFAPRADATAEVVALDLVGSRAVAYVPGTAAEPLPAGQSIVGREPVTLAEQMTALRGQSADILAEWRGFDRIALGRRLSGVQVAVARTRAAAAAFPTDSVRVALEAAFRNTDSLLVHVRALAAALLGDSTKPLDTLRVSVGQLAEQAANVQDVLDRIQTSLREGEGTAGRVRSDRALREAIADVRHSLELLQLKFLGRVPPGTRADTAR